MSRVLKSDGSALPVSYQQPGPTSLFESKHFPEARATGSADREAVNRREAHATGCYTGPSSRIVGVSAIAGSMAALIRTPAVDATSSSFLGEGTMQSSGSAPQVSYQRPGPSAPSILYQQESAHFPWACDAGGADMEAARGREAHATGCCTAPASWSVGNPSTTLIEALVTIDDGTLLSLRIGAADRCKEVAQHFVLSNYLQR